MLAYSTGPEQYTNAGAESQAMRKPSSFMVAFWCTGVQNNDRMHAVSPNLHGTFRFATGVAVATSNVMTCSMPVGDDQNKIRKTWIVCHPKWVACRAGLGVSGTPLLKREK